MTATEINKIFGAIDKRVRVAERQGRSKNDIFLCIDLKSLTEMLQQAATKYNKDYDVVNGALLHKIQENNLMIHGVVGRVICDEGLGWFVGDLADVA